MANEVFDNLVDQVNDQEIRIEDLESNSVDNLSDTLSQIQEQQTQDEQNIGQLMFPLTQDTIDLINGVISNSLGSGQVTLVSGVKTVSDTRVNADSIILLSRNSVNGSSAIGLLYVSAQSTGSFTITSEAIVAHNSTSPIQYKDWSNTNQSFYPVDGITMSGTQTNDNSIVNYLIINI